MRRTDRYGRLCGAAFDYGSGGSVSGFGSYNSHVGSLLLAPVAVLCLLFTSFAHAQELAGLKTRHAELQQQLLTNHFQRPLYLESHESKGELKGDIYAQLAYPFAAASQALQSVTRLCDILILHLNVKGCRASSTDADSLTMHVGRKFDQPLGDAYLFEFARKVVVSEGYLHVTLTAAKGPMSTSNYRVVFEMMPLDTKRSFLHLSYGYDYGAAARVAMYSYLATIGRDKVGFSIAEKKPTGEPIYTNSVRGIVERNTMRYYLAIEAYLGAPLPQQLNKRLNDWQTGVERYPLQLQEMERADYIAMKRKEIKRQQTPVVAGVVVPK